MLNSFKLSLFIIFSLLLSSCGAVKVSKEQSRMRDSVNDINKISDYDLCYLAVNSFSISYGGVLWGTQKKDKKFVNAAKDRGMTCGVSTQKKISTKKIKEWNNFELCNYADKHYEKKIRYSKETKNIIDVVMPEAQSRKLTCIASYSLPLNTSRAKKVENSPISDSLSFKKLNSLSKKVVENKNALALIIGIANYENTNANAIYADKDAKSFRDYASSKLGVSSNRINTLINEDADYGEILLKTKNWLRRLTKKNKTDIYIFFAGHGLASDDGKNMFLLPYDGRPELLKDTALMRNRLFKEIQQSNPRSVTVFLDTCYSGTTRGTDMLIASRPIVIRALKQSIPSNFTVFSAAAGDQTSKPLEEAKHGMFSYFLMKGMEGDADSNNDNKITAQELHNYVKENVTQQSSGSQTPELQGNKDRVLVQFN